MDVGNIIGTLLGLATGLALIVTFHKNAVIRELKEELDDMTGSREWWRARYDELSARYYQSGRAETDRQKWSLDWPKLVDPQPADDALVRQECEASCTVSPRWTVHGSAP